MNSVFCDVAIHQRLESDGTERVEGSMTQRLENILNSKHHFIKSPAQNDIAVSFYLSRPSCYFTGFGYFPKQQLSVILICFEKFSRKNSFTYNTVMYISCKIANNVVCV